MKTKKEEFIEYCVKYQEGMNTGNSRLANKFHDKIEKLYKSIDRITRIEMLKELIVSNDLNLKLWAATYLLKENTEITDAIETLKNILKTDTIESSNAELVLYSWENKSFSFFK